MQPTGQPSTNPTEAFTTLITIEATLSIGGITQDDFSAVGDRVLRDMFSTLIPDIRPADVIMKEIVIVESSNSNSNEPLLHLTTSSDFLEVSVELSVYMGKFDFVLQEGMNAQDAYESQNLVYSKVEDLINEVFVGDEGSSSPFQTMLREYGHEFPQSNPNSIFFIDHALSRAGINIIHTPQPSSMPTSMPTCSVGSFMISPEVRRVGYFTNCGPCPPGSFQDKAGQ